MNLLSVHVHCTDPQALVESGGCATTGQLQC